jgi:hypothetical protein
MLNIDIDCCKDEAMSTEADSYPSSYLINCIDEADAANAKRQSVRPADERLTVLETKKVRVLRVLAFAVLLVSTLILGIVVYFYSSGKEQQLMKKNIIADSQKILGDFGTSMAITMGSIDSFAVTAVVSKRRRRENNTLCIIKSSARSLSQYSSSSFSHLLGRPIKAGPLSQSLTLKSVHPRSDFFPRLCT